MSGAFLPLEQQQMPSDVVMAGVPGGIPVGR
jgi:hypothetical protein